jgi:hypothetical protein
LKPDFEELKRDDDEGLYRACRCAGEDGEGLCDSWRIENVLVEGREGVVCRELDSADLVSYDPGSCWG